MLFVGIYFTLGLIDWSTFSTNTLGDARNHRSLYDTLVVIHPPDAVVVCIANVDFDVSQIFVVKTGYTAWLIKCALEGGLVDHLIFTGTKPRKDLISEGIEYFDLVIVCVCYDYDVLLGDEVDAEWVLQLGFDTNSVSITVCVQVPWIRITTAEVSCTLQGLHIDRTNARRFRIGHIEFNMAG